MTDLALPPTSNAFVVAAERAHAVAMAGELVAHVMAELPALATLEDRDRLLAAAWLASLRSARTRRSYAGDLLGWRAWLAMRGIELLGAGRVHVDLWVRAQQHAGAGDASVRRRLSGIGSFYRYCLAHDLASGDPTAGVARPRVDPDYTATVAVPGAGSALDIPLPRMSDKQTYDSYAPSEPAVGAAVAGGLMCRRRPVAQS